MGAGLRADHLIGLTGLFVLSGFFVTEGYTAPKFDGAAPLQWSARLAISEMARRGHSLQWQEEGAAKWDYTTGLFAWSLLALHEHVNDVRYVKYAETTIGSFIAPD